MLKTLPTFNYPGWNFPCWVPLVGWFIYFKGNFSQNTLPFPRMKLEKNTLLWLCLKQNLEISTLPKRSWKREFSLWVCPVLFLWNSETVFQKLWTAFLEGGKKIHFHCRSLFPGSIYMGTGGCNKEILPLSWACSIQDYVVGVVVFVFCFGGVVYLSVFYSVHSYSHPFEIHPNIKRQGKDQDCPELLIPTLLPSW